VSGCLDLPMGVVGEFFLFRGNLVLICFFHSKGNVILVFVWNGEWKQ